MIAPPIPTNEKKRLQALSEYAIDNMFFEKDFVDIAKLAAEICAIPAAYINVIGDTQQWTKASNLDMEFEVVNRKESFCAHCLTAPEALIVPDARADERFIDNPFTSTEEGYVIFYTGIPLRNSEGYAIGTLCITDNKPRKLSTGQLQTLKVLANQVIQLFELRRSKALLKNAYNKVASLHDKEQEQFAYSISHDLQVPLQNIINFSNLLQTKYRQTLDKNASQYLDFILSSSSRMKELINSLLDYARIGQRKEFTLVDCNDLVNTVLIDLKTAIEETKATITINQLPTLQVLKSEFSLLFQNLLSNALKFRQPTVSPSIEVSARKENQSWLFSVKDNGIGIDEKFIEKIFFLFQRLHGQNTYEGSGIGLAHCKKIVSLHHGDIWVESIPKEGSTFYFTIPIDIYEK